MKRRSKDESALKTSCFIKDSLDQKCHRKSDIYFQARQVRQPHSPRVGTSTMNLFTVMFLVTWGGFLKGAITIPGINVPGIRHIYP